MPGRGCGKGGRKHTPLVSKAQRRLFGAKRARGEISAAVVERHMKESKGKDLPERVGDRRARRRGKGR